MTERARTKEDAIRDFILQKSEDLFVRNGYEKTSMDKIARACDLSKPTLYNYFKGKNDLFMGIHVRCHEDMNGLILQLLKQAKPPLDILEEIFDATVRFYGEHREFLRVFNVEFHHLTHANLAEHIDWTISSRKTMSGVLTEFLAGIIRPEVKKRFDAATVAGIILSMFETLFYDLAVSESDNIATYKEIVFYIIKNSLLK
jgi:TetR/AcrR family transcriptional regulator